jgi:hypothetical protein
VKGSSPTSPDDLLAGHLPHVQEIAEVLKSAERLLLAALD